MAMKFGGWYNNPATGKNQRWWGGNEWTNGEDPTQGLGVNWKSILASQSKAASKGDLTAVSGAPTSEQIAQGIIDAQKKQIEQETGYLKKYQTENPFVFDEAFARESATAEYEPYYQRLLEDYLSTVEPKKASLQDQTKLLQDLYKLDTTGRTNLYDRAIQGAEEGAAGRGMFFSGVNKRSVGEKTVDYGLAEEQAGKKFEYGKGVLGRQGEALTLEEAVQRRTTGEEQATAIEGGILKRGKEAAVKYYTARDLPYYRQFPSSSGSALRGYDIPDYLRF